MGVALGSAAAGGSAEKPNAFATPGSVPLGLLIDIGPLVQKAAQTALTSFLLLIASRVLQYISAVQSLSG